LNINAKKLIILISLAIVFISCKNEKTIDEEEFARLYYNLLVIQEKFKADSILLKSEQDKLFQKSGVIEKQYYSTLTAYNKDPERWRTFFEYLKSYTDTMQKKPMRR